MDQRTGREEFGLASGEVRRAPTAGLAQMRTYVVALCSFPFLLVLGTLFWMSTGAYPRHAQYAYLSGIGYGMKLHGANCDIVVTGDSTALTGVRPEIIAQRTGMSACNIAELAGAQAVNGMIVPDGYLRHNKPPKFLIFLYAPENLTPASQWKGVATYEGVFLRLQTLGLRGLWPFLKSHPNEVLTDAEFGFRNGVQWGLHRPLSPDKIHIRDQTLGRLPLPGATLKHCPEHADMRAPDAAWLASLREKYAANGTRVFIDVTPEPPCDATRAFYEQHLTPGLIDNTLGTLPLRMYTETGRLHTNDEGAAALSALLADQVVQARAGAH